MTTNLDSRFTFGNRTRIVVLVLTTLTLSFVMANSLALNFTVLCMKKNASDTNENEDDVNKNLMFDLGERSWLFSAIAIGNLIGTIPFIKWCSLRSLREAFTAYALISVVATALTPLAAHYGFVFIFACRFLQGISIGAAWPMMGTVTSEWSTLRLSGTYVAFLSCHLQMGSVITMPISGLLCVSSLGWSGVYYIQAGLTLALVVLFHMFFRDSPSNHRNVSSKELTSIQKKKEHMRYESERPPTPFRAIFTDLAAWGCISCCFSGNLGFQFLNQYGPIYLKEILKFDVKSTGFLTALPYILAIIVKICAGPLSDWMPYVSVRTRVMIFTCASQFTMAFSYIVLSFMTPKLHVLAQVCFTAAVVFSGLNCVGSISGSYVFVLMAINSLSSSFWVLVLPGIVSLMAPTNSQSEWFLMYMVFGCYVVVSTVFFMFVGQAEPREWAKVGTISRTQSKVVSNDGPGQI